MTTTPDAQPAAPSAAPSSVSQPVSGQAVIDGMDSAQRAKWELTGELPTQATPADSPSATPAAQAASTDATPSPASEPGTPPKTGHKGNADTRVQELLAERARDREEATRLRERLDALERGSRPDARTAESSPATAPTKAEYERYLEMPNAPKEESFDSYAKFTAAMGVFITDQRWQEHQQRAQAHDSVTRELQAIDKVSETAKARIEARTKDDPDFASKVNPDLLEIPTASQVRATARALHAQGKVREATELMRSMNGGNVLADVTARSEQVDKLLEHFSTEDGRAEWHRLSALPQADLLRAFGRLEGRLEGASAPSVSTAPAPKTLSTAPKPATTVGHRPVEPIDPSEAALKRKDYAAYEAAENAKAMAGVGAR